MSSSSSASQDNGRDDRGGILIFVLVAVSIISLIVLPMLSYTTAVFRSGEVQADRAQATELASGGTWVALANGRNLYDLCTPSGATLSSSLPGVTTTCTLLDTKNLRPPTEMPFEVATVQSGRPVPAQVATSQTYANPSPPGSYDAWVAAASATPAENKVWMPQLPVQATSAGGTRDTEMKPNTQDPKFSSCRVFFPGTYTTPIEISQPAYFTSGVYYFTQPITLKNRANVVVGNGSEVGCTTDYEAVSFAKKVPDPLNMSGLGGTFVLGEDARITVDDSGSGDIRFAINQRYVSTDEKSVAASSDVAIVSVNGRHEPFLSGESLGQDFDVTGVLKVPASTVGTDGNPKATDSGYRPSKLTPRPTVPDAPLITGASALRNGDGGGTPSSDSGWLRVDWSIPNDNGALVTKYSVTDSVSGKSCSPRAPTLPDTSVQTSCTIVGIPDGKVPKVTVTATNEYGTSAPSAVFTAPQVKYTAGSGQVPQVSGASKVKSLSTTSFSDGVEVSFDSPNSDGGSAIIFYYVRMTEKTNPNNQFVCLAWWDELGCVIPTGVGLTAGLEYDVDVWPVLRDGTNDRYYFGSNSNKKITFSPAGGPAPVQVAKTANPREASAIVELVTKKSTNIDVKIDGYVSVPQGRIAISSAAPSKASISMTGGVLAGEIFLDGRNPPSDPSRIPTKKFEVKFDNPVAQKQVHIISTVTGKRSAKSEAVIQINRSGSLAINSWVVQ